jgi:hypothetical protein
MTNFDDFIQRKLNEQKIINFTQDEKDELEAFKFKDEDTKMVYEFHHTALYVSKIEKGYLAELQAYAEMKEDEEIYLKSELHSIYQIKNVLELSKELDQIVKKFERSHMS